MMKPDGQFRKSSFTPAYPQAPYYCVEVALDKDTVRVRDTKNPDGGTLTFNYKEWGAFIKGVKAGEFDFPA